MKQSLTNIFENNITRLDHTVMYLTLKRMKYCYETLYLLFRKVGIVYVQQSLKLSVHFLQKRFNWISVLNFQNILEHSNNRYRIFEHEYLILRLPMYEIFVFGQFDKKKHIQYFCRAQLQQTWKKMQMHKHCLGKFLRIGKFFCQYNHIFCALALIYHTQM